ncbi:MAG TPA: hypothetical protein VEF04_20405 [Blastocatellia bacterium]|nr:hypothetical protein [Blastocatellia bacterium]
MRKRVINQHHKTRDEEGHWLDLEHLATVEVTSEDKDHPIEAALLPDHSSGWKAADPGPQTIRLVFDEPQQIKHIRLVFTENEHERTLEFVLRWLSGSSSGGREIVRQQFTFSPLGTTREIEDYRVELQGVMVLELMINPNISSTSAYASLDQLRLA